MTLTFLIISLVAIVFLLIYARWLIKIIRTKEEDVDNLSIILSDYISHVKSVHEMEMFYGDPTLQRLIDHGTEMINKIDDFDYFILDEPEDPIEEEAE